MPSCSLTFSQPISIFKYAIPASAFNQFPSLNMQFQRVLLHPSLIIVLSLTSQIIFKMEILHSIAPRTGVRTSKATFTFQENS